MLPVDVLWESMTFNEFLTKLKVLLFKEAYNGRCYYQLRQLRTVRRALSKETSKLLVHALIISRLDYCNSVFNNVAAVHLHPLQSVLHAAARLVVQMKKYDYITADIRDYLHWLPVNYRIYFKLCALMYKCLHRTASVYLSDMCTLISTNPTRSLLRSASSGDLIVPRTRTVTYALAVSLSVVQLPGTPYLLTSVIRYSL